ncbi:MAG: 5-methyltetrahydropteroyltriglutamate--homocysteine S-methyltransferase [Spirochaetales bacterium]|nr:5-methyltetrahydropteroyltriglutamate--homocysteine S-methyltransferase [Spirochaetales bacterium]
MKDIKTHIPGFPRIGKNRELKKALEAYWKGPLSIDGLLQKADEIKAYNWLVQSGLDYITAGDFALYDHILDASIMFGNIPARFGNSGLKNRFDLMFAMARGALRGEETVNASPMTKWFNTNYHYITPETGRDTEFSLDASALLEDIRKAGKTGKKVKPIIPGPVTYLWLGANAEADNLSGKTLDRLCACYQQLLEVLKLEKIEWVQIDEPVAAFDWLEDSWKKALVKAWSFFEKLADRPKLMLTSYFVSPLDSAEFLSSLPADGYHLDLCGDGSPKSRREITSRLDRLTAFFPETAVLSLGLIDGRNIWKADLAELHAALNSCAVLSGREIWLAASCSLLHLPYTTAPEDNLDKDLYGMLCFAEEKINELVQLKIACESGIDAIGEYLAGYRVQLDRYRNFLGRRKSGLRSPGYKARSAAEIRKPKQAAALGLPLLPVTTIGSFPQTAEVRKMRSQYKKGLFDTEGYKAFIKKQISEVIAWQEKTGIDVLVHGEFERSDMVEYFCEAFEGFATSDFGWVQSYGSRCVKPAIVCSDIRRNGPLTVEWITYAQGLTEKPVKGMLTGPVTIIKWCFPRCDIPFREQVFQTAAAVNAEVLDLERAGIRVIQIDEAAFREAQPLSVRERKEYGSWAPESFRLCTSGVKDETQIHTHMCYSEFAGILEAVKNMDADVLTIEASRSDMAILKPFSGIKGFNQFGPGVYDVHSPEVPDVETLKSRIGKALRILGPDRLWINPDCGLKTRGWEETRASLENIVRAAEETRGTLNG